MLGLFLYLNLSARLKSLGSYLNVFLILGVKQFFTTRNMIRLYSHMH